MLKIIFQLLCILCTTVCVRMCSMEHPTQSSFSNVDDLNNEPSAPDNPLIVAAAKGHMDTVRQALQDKSNLKATSKKGGTALHWAAQNGHEGVARLLLQAGAEIGATTSSGHTPLHWAAGRGHAGMVRLLLSAGANKDAVAANFGNITPLHCAAVGKQPTLTMLIRASTNPDVEAHLYGDAGNEHEGVINLLRQAGANLAAVNIMGDTPLHWASFHGHEGLVRALLASGASVDIGNIGNTDGETPLHEAAANGHEGVVRILLSAGANKEATRKDDGATPLHVAVCNGHERVVKLLIDSGAQIGARTTQGNTPLMLARRLIRPNVEQALLAEASRP